MYRANFTCDYSFKVYGCYSQEEKFCIIKSLSGGNCLKMCWWQWRDADAYSENPMDKQRSHGWDVTSCEQRPDAAGPLGPGGCWPGRAGTARRHRQQQLRLVLRARQRDSSASTDMRRNLTYLGPERSPGDKPYTAMISHDGSAQI